jgi:molybdate transport system ATP-binding protein
VSLLVAIRHPLERVTIDVDFATDGGLTALLGPSGAGKTTILNAIAGVLRPQQARIEFGGVPLTDTSRALFVPPHERLIGYVFQDSRLFPHLTVRQNLGFGRWFAARRQRETARLDDIVSLLGLAPLLNRHPAKLSGGEKRRVALGRALLSSPRLLLLDEPLGSLEIARRQEILPYLDRLIAELKLPAIYVTHDWSEIEGRAARVIHVQDGRMVAPGKSVHGPTGD